METKIFKNYNEFGSRTNKSTNGVTEDFLKDINKTLEDVEEFLSDCEGCWNCTNCINCTKCTDCTHCSECFEED